MPKKKTKGSPVPPPLDVTIKPVRVDLTEDAHRMLRKVAADEGVSMAAYAREMFERIIREEFKRRGLR